MSRASGNARAGQQTLRLAQSRRGLAVASAPGCGVPVSVMQPRLESGDSEYSLFQACFGRPQGPLLFAHERTQGDGQTHEAIRSLHENGKSQVKHERNG